MAPAKDCERIRAALSEYLNLELPEGGCEALESHLEYCAPCREFVSSLRATIELCRQYHPDEIPAPLSERARRELQVAYRTMLAARGEWN